MLRLKLEFSPTIQYGVCEVSLNLLDEWGSDNTTKYASVRLPAYNRYNQDAKVLCCSVNHNLPLDTVRVPCKMFQLSSTELAVNCCYFKPLNGCPPVLQSVALLLKSDLYDFLHQLPKLDHRLEFLQAKYCIEDTKTVIQIGDVIAPSWCAVAFCSPGTLGVIDFQKTQIVLVKDTNQLLRPIIGDKGDNIINLNTLSLREGKEILVNLRCLETPVPLDLISPIPRPTDDDSIFAFADIQTMVALGTASGSFVRISNGKTSRAVKLFVLASPNDFETFTLYTQPRIMANFAGDGKVTVTKYFLDQLNIPLASSMSISRVGSWYQSQKVFQNIILHNLKAFFTLKKRILHPGDMIPVTFDSNLAGLFSENMDDVPLETNDDTLVWFRVENVEFREGERNAVGEEFLIDPSKTKLITANIILHPPLKLSHCDYVSYYNLEPVFQYNPEIFPWAKRFLDILKAALDSPNVPSSISTSVLLHSSVPTVGKSTLVRYAAQLLGFHLLPIDCMSLTTHLGSLDSIPKIVGYLRGKFESVLPTVSPAIVYLSHMNVILTKGEHNQDSEALKLGKLMDVEMSKLIQELSTVFPRTVFVGSVYDLDSISQIIRTQMKFEIAVPVPTEPQRQAIFEWYLSPYLLHLDLNKCSRTITIASDVKHHKLAQQSAGLTPLDLKSIVQIAKWNRIKHELTTNKNDRSGWNDDCPIAITMKDLSLSIGRARDEFSVAIGAPKIPNVTWEDIGGVDMVKGEILDTIDMPLKHPELFASGMKKRSGVLFYGPPGTGKTLMAKAIATNFSLNFFSVKGPELLNMYIGESEANVRRVFQKARDAKPCAIFFDELDSIAPKRGNQGDSGGVMDRIVSQLLAELDGMDSGGEGVFVIGATNRPDLLDEALLRPGRFDKLLYLGISDTNEKQLNILTALTRKFALSPDVDLQLLAESCPFNYTGADFYALCSDAMLNAMTRIASEVDEKVRTYNKVHNEQVSVRYWFDRIATSNDTKVIVRMTDFIEAQKVLIPSVSEDELNHYLQVKKSFENNS
ncbi:related to Peroxisomal ATPase PEX6 [Zygosaccharomyces bailii]|nr:related to Peroxisomal ATPase PEX6 [Zygosaccharomyces bailii]